MSIIEDVAAVVAELPAEALSILLELVRGAAASDDPARYLARRVTAEAAHEVSEEALRAALKGGA